MQGFNLEMMASGLEIRKRIKSGYKTKIEKAILNQIEIQSIESEHCNQGMNPYALSEHHRTETHKKGESAFFERESNVPFDIK